MGKWTRAMRAQAAAHGRRGGLKGNREGKRVGGMLAWYGKTPEQRAAVLAAFKANRGKQTNTSARARRAQGARRMDASGQVRVHSGAQAVKMAELGLLCKVDVMPVVASVAPVAHVAPSAPPLAPTVTTAGPGTYEEERQRRWREAQARKPDAAAYKGSVDHYEAMAKWAKECMAIQRGEW